MRTLCVPAVAAALLAVLLPAAAHGQAISVTALGGAYIPATDFAELEGEAREVRVERESAFALGLNVQLGSLRGTLRYVTDATLSEEGLDDSSAIESGSLLAGSVDMVFRPLPRLLGVQPYALGGAGFKRLGYSYRDEGVSNPFPSSERLFSLHLGLGVDLSVGPVGLVLEADDFITFAGGDLSPHDAFVMLGVRLGL